MNKKIAISGTLAVVLVAAAVVAVDVFPSEIKPLTSLDQAGFSDDQIELGHNLTLIGDCTSCHQPKGTKHMSGGVALPTPFGTIYSTNITPDFQNGIGSWSYEAFERSMRDGIDRDGNHLYPAFPYDHFAATTDEDLTAVYQFLMTREPIASEPKQNELSFPFSLRPLLAGWKLLFHNNAPFEADPALTVEENRGAYLTNTLGHCSACHSPRNMFGAVKKNSFFEGGEAEGWIIPPLAEHSISTVGWDIDDYADYLFDGWSEKHGIAGGPMTEVVDNLYEANEDDVFAIAAWLAKITPPIEPDKSSKRFKAIASLDLPEDFDVTFVGQDVPPNILSGAQIFKGKCVKCHKARLVKSQPVSLGLSFSVNDDSPKNLFNIILKGIEPPLGVSSRKMQAISLSEEELAAVASFVRWRFSDQAEWMDLATDAKEAAEGSPPH